MREFAKIKSFQVDSGRSNPYAIELDIIIYCTKPATDAQLTLHDPRQDQTQTTSSWHRLREVLKVKSSQVDRGRSETGAIQAGYHNQSHRTGNRCVKIKSRRLRIAIN